MLKQNQIPEEYANGNCYESAANHLIDFVTEFGIKSMVLVHGIVIGQKAIEGIKYIHAWTEYNGLVFDFSNGNKVCMSIDDWYKAGQVQRTVKYSFEEARDHIVLEGHYGYWDKSLGAMEDIKWTN